MGVARGLAAGGTFAAVAIGLAFHAAGEPPIGRYTATEIDASSGQEVPGETSTLTFQACGPECTHVVGPVGAFDLRLQDGAWTGKTTTPDGHPCSATLDARLIWTDSCEGPPIHAQLRKSG